MQNVLVTGGAGFIGSNFVRYLLNKEPDVQIINLDALTYSGSLENLKGILNPERHTFIEGDICDRDLVEKILHTQNIDTIVHFAAETHVDRSILGPGQFVRQTLSAHTYCWRSLVKFGSRESNQANHGWMMSVSITYPQMKSTVHSTQVTLPSRNPQIMRLIPPTRLQRLPAITSFELTGKPIVCRTRLLIAPITMDRTSSQRN